jgi:uncharacterized protein
MIIELANVPIRPKSIELKFQPNEIDLDPDDAVLAGPVTFAGETEKVHERVHVRGHVAAEAEIACFRCLQPVRRSLDIDFDDVFVGEESGPTEAEIALAIEDLNIAIAEGGTIDLADVAREQLLLALSDQVLCKEDCRGLCPKCGANRNLLDCKCIEKEIDPRWSALRDLK